MLLSYNLNYMTNNHINHRQVWQSVPIIPAPVKLRKLPNHRFKASLFYIPSSRPTRTVQKGLASKKENTIIMYLYAIHHLKTTFPPLKHQTLIPVVGRQVSALSVIHMLTF